MLNLERDLNLYSRAEYLPARGVGAYRLDRVYDQNIKHGKSVKSWVTVVWGLSTANTYQPFLLTAHLAKWKKRRFLTCPCHKIYREEAVGLKVPTILEKLRFLWICNILGNFVKIWHFTKNCLLKVRILKSLSSYVTRIIVIICRKPHFVST